VQCDGQLSCSRVSDVVRLVASSHGRCDLHRNKRRATQRRGVDVADRAIPSVGGVRRTRPWSRRAGGMKGVRGEKGVGEKGNGREARAGWGEDASRFRGLMREVVGQPLGICSSDLAAWCERGRLQARYPPFQLSGWDPPCCKLTEGAKAGHQQGTSLDSTVAKTTRKAWCTYGVFPSQLGIYSPGPTQYRAGRGNKPQTAARFGPGTST
jgi:hypothetical protein